MDLEVYHDMSRRYSELPAFPSRTERNCHCHLNCDQAQDSWKLFHLTNVPNFREANHPAGHEKPEPKSEGFLHHVTNKVALYSIKCTRGAEG